MRRARGISFDSDDSALSQDKTPIEEWIKSLYKGGKVCAAEFLDGARAEAASSSAPSTLAARLAPATRCRQNASRDANRLLKKTVDRMRLPESYIAETCFWDNDCDERYIAEVVFLSIQHIRGEC